MVVVQRRRQVSRLDPRSGRVEGGPIGRDRIVPHAELEEDVGRHVQRVARPRDRGVGARRLQCQPGVFGIVVVVQQVVKRSGMPRVRGQHLFENSCHLLLRFAPCQTMTVPLGRVHVTNEAARHRSEQGQRMKGRHFRIVRLTRVEARHRVGIGASALGEVAFAEEDLDGCDERSFGRGERRDVRIGAQARQRLACRVDVLASPERLVVGHRLAPVRHREATIDLLGLLKGVDGVLGTRNRGEPPPRAETRAARAPIRMSGR